MIVLSNTTAQTLLPGQSITFDKVEFKSGCAECTSRVSNYVRLRANGGVYLVAFSGNISVSTVAPGQLNIAVSSAVLPETTMISTPAAVDTFNNVATQTRVRTLKCSGGDVVSVTNTGTTTITVAANSALVIDRRG